MFYRPFLLEAGIFYQGAVCYQGAACANPGRGRESTGVPNKLAKRGLNQNTLSSRDLEPFEFVVAVMAAYVAERSVTL